MNAAREALNRAVNKAIADGAPVYVNQPDAADAAADERTRIGNTPTELLDPESDEAAALLDAAKTAQTAYWAAVKALEDALGEEIDSTDDLQNFSDCAELIRMNTI